MSFMLGWFLCWYSVAGLNFDTSRIIEVKLNDSDVVENSYFGYSLLLQKGLNPMVIVGAPKQNKRGGAVFGCNIFNSNSSACIKYNMEILTNGTSFNGNFLGSALDGGENVGDSFVACAPREIYKTGWGKRTEYWPKGLCLCKSNSTNFNTKVTQYYPLKNSAEITKLRGEIIPNYGYAEAGFDVYYNPRLSELYLGAVGVYNWQGSVIVQNLQNVSKYQVLHANWNDGYLGYKVTFGTFDNKSYIIAGTPRGNKIRGRVVIYSGNKMYRVLEGEEVGSYFGSALLAEDVDNNQSDDLFVGAPMTSGNRFEEGCVYYFGNALKTRTETVKLFGDRKQRARFGTNIISLGDIDLDLFKDIAISAPYEDDGVGAVYIYRGSKNGINLKYSQRLSPLGFPGYYGNLRGFGMGLSRGVDVDNNGHNDLAVGAYESGRAFVLTTKPIIDLYITLETNVNAIIKNTNISITYCLTYTFRVPKTLETVDFEWKLSLDHRISGKKNSDELITCYPQKPVCRTEWAFIRDSHTIFESFKFVLLAEVKSNVFAEGTKIIEKLIPYAHGCGDDNICQTEILLVVTPSSNSIVLGLNNSINVNVRAVNKGEPAYQCEIYIQIPEEIELKLNRRCKFEKFTYICSFANKIETKQELLIPFHIISNKITFKSININFDFKCLGENAEFLNQTLTIDVVIKNSVYIEGKSIPSENIEFSDKDTNDQTNIRIVNIFTVSNFGPSPAKVNIYFLVPKIKIGNDDLFRDVNVMSETNGNQIQCELTNKIHKQIPKYDVSLSVKAPLDKTIILDCFKDLECLELFCEGNILYKSSQNEKFYLKFETNPKLLGRYFQSRTVSKNILAFVTTAIFNGTSPIIGHTSTLILSTHSKSLPNWLILVAVIVGAILLCLLIFLLFKCKFFKREYRDKLHIEKLILELHSNQLENLNEEQEEQEDEDGDTLG